MRTYVFSGVMTAMSSIAHGGESYGVHAKFHREKAILANGTVEDIPTISGNSIRGMLRDRGMLHMLRAIGYDVDIDRQSGEYTGLDLPVFYFLFSGGALTKIAGRGLDIDLARKWRELIPLVALFGGASGNQIMPGQAKIDKAFPICQELLHLLPKDIVDPGRYIPSIWEIVQEEGYVRRDDEKDEKLRRLISPEARRLLEDQARQTRAKAGTKEDKAGKTGQKQQQRYFVETLAMGTQFFWECALDDVTDVEFEAFVTTLAEFMKFPYIGGKSGIGHGKISLQFNGWKELTPILERNGREIDAPLGTRYANHLKNNANQIRELLNGVSR